MSQAQILDQVKEKVNGFLSQYPQIDKPITDLSQKVGFEKAFVAIGIVLVPILLFFALSSGDFLVDLVGFIYPVYASIKAIETKTKEDDAQWLTYWLVFGLFKVIEGPADFLISSIPFYFFIKIGFLVWCMHPSTQGAKVVYENVIKPHVVPHLGLDAKKSE